MKPGAIGVMFPELAGTQCCFLEYVCDAVCSHRLSLSVLFLRLLGHKGLEAELAGFGWFQGLVPRAFFFFFSGWEFVFACNHMVLLTPS